MRLTAATSILALLATAAHGAPTAAAAAPPTSCGAAPEVAAPAKAAPEKAAPAQNATAPPPPAAGGGAKAGGNTTALVLPDGRIAKDATPENFNVLASVFKSAVVKGDGLKFSDLIVFPDVAPSMFDTATNTKAFEITISDKSVFIPQGGEAQSNIRRADLLPSIRSTLNDVATTGVRTMHFSVQPDPARPLDTAHDYQIMNLESKDFSFHQIDVRTGGENAGKIVVNGNSKDGGKTLFATPDFADGTYQNFALKMDFTANTVQVFHSTGNEPLKQVTEPLANDLTGNGEYHFSLQKNPVGTEAQKAGINEGLIFAGIFMEDSTDGKVSLQ